MSEAAPVQHADSPPEPQRQAKAIIAQILALRQGRESAISSADLAERTPVNASTVRDLVPQIVEEYRLPIVSCPDGYYRLRPEEDHDAFVRTMERYEGQQQAAKRRMRALAAAYNGHREAVE